MTLRTSTPCRDTTALSPSPNTSTGPLAAEGAPVPTNEAGGQHQKDGDPDAHGERKPPPGGDGP